MFGGEQHVDPALEGTHVAWVQMGRTSKDVGRLPDPRLEVPDRDPAQVRDHPVSAAYRTLYEELGIDPEEYTPSGERLAQRLAEEGSLPRQASLLDAVRLASALTLVPLSAHDLDRLDPPLNVRRSREETKFETARGEVQPVPEGFPLVRDQEGPVEMLAYANGERAAPTKQTTKALLVACGPPTTAPRLLPEALRQVERYATLVGWRFATSTRTLKLGANT